VLAAAFFLTTSVARPSATTESNVSGRVIEAFSGRPLAAATVSAAGRTVQTDADGRFELRLPTGTWTIEASAAGHLPESRAVEVAAGVERRIDLYVLDRTRLQERIEVNADVGVDSEAPTAIPVTPQDVEGVAGGAENIFRTLQTLPGVVATDELGSRLAVRGGGPDENLTIMDGVEIHNPYRLFGLTSAFNPETVSRSELYTGAFSAKYGDRLSSLLVIENRDGARDRRVTGSSALSLTDANLILEGRLPGRAQGSWLVTGRRTYYDLVAERFTNSKLPAFDDLQGRVTWSPRTGQHLTLLALRSRESTDASFTGDRVGEQGAFLTGARNDLVSLHHDALVGGRLSARTTAAWYRNTDALNVNAQFRDESRRSNAPGVDEGFALSNVVFTRNLAVRDLSLREELAWQASSRHLVELGGELHDLRTAVTWDISGGRNLNEANPSSQRGGAALPGLLDSAWPGRRSGAYVQDRWQATRALVLEPGLRLDYSGVNGQATLTPRLAVTFFLDGATRVHAGAGLFTQSPGYEKLVQSDYFLDLSDARRLGLAYERARHAVLGLERDLPAGTQVRLEGYYKRFDDLIVGRLETEAERQARIATYDFPASLADQTPTEPQITTFPLNGGAGRAYGFDLYLARRPQSPTTRLSGWVSYTWGKAERDVYGRRFPFEYDRRHALSLVTSWRLGGKLELASTVRVASGFPRTPVVGLRVSAVEVPVDPALPDGAKHRVPERNAEGRLVWTPDLGGLDNLNSARLPVFARVDLRLNFKPKGARGRWLFYLDFINLLNRKNAGAIDTTLEYDPTADRPRPVEKPAASLPFLPSFGIRVKL
jgi:hypothetical protein